MRTRDGKFVRKKVRRTHFICAVAGLNGSLQWLKQFGKLEGRRIKTRSQQEENRRLRAESKRVTEERDILKKSAAYFAKESR